MKNPQSISYDYCKILFKENEVYKKTWVVADFFDEEKSIDEQNNLVLTKSQIITASEQEIVCTSYTVTFINLL